MKRCDKKCLRFIANDSKRETRIASLLALKPQNCRWSPDQLHPIFVRFIRCVCFASLSHFSGWCVYGGLVQVHRIFSYINKWRGAIYLLFPQFILCYGMRASHYIIIYISALKSIHTEYIYRVAWDRRASSVDACVWERESERVWDKNWEWKPAILLNCIHTVYCTCPVIDGDGWRVRANTICAKWFIFTLFSCVQILKKFLVSRLLHELKPPPYKHSHTHTCLVTVFRVKRNDTEIHIKGVKN